jgi:hypothetical protein
MSTLLWLRMLLMLTASVSLMSNLRWRNGRGFLSSYFSIIRGGPKSLWWATSIIVYTISYIDSSQDIFPVKVCIFPSRQSEQFFSYPLESCVTITGDCQGYMYMPFSTSWCLVVRVLLRSTPAATRDLDLYGLIQRTDHYVPQRNSNPRCKDHPILTLLL